MSKERAAKIANSPNSPNSSEHGGKQSGKGGDVELHGGPVRLDFLRVPEGKEVKNRLHLDLYIPPESRIDMIKQAIQLGATRAADLYNGGRWQVMRDIEGTEFCIVWGAGIAESP